MTRSALGGSAFVHLALLAGVFAMQSRAPRLIVGPEVIQLALLQSTPTPAPPAAAVTPPPARAPELRPEEGTGVKIAPVKPKPVKRAPPQPKAEPAPPTLALPSATIGAGLRGDVSVDAGDFEFSYYLLLLRNRIAQNWTPPAGLVASGAPIRAVVYFRVDHQGGVRDARLESSSSVEFFDRSALRAVMLSDPLPPLPTGYPGASLGVHFGFEYTTP